MRSLPTPVEWAHSILSPCLEPGDWSLDATAGNGHDTLFLAKCVMPNGRVFALDIQPSALSAARARLESAGLAESCTLILGGHENMAALLPQSARGNLAAVMFNLGWLPGHDKHCITRAASTLPALQSALDWLRPGGHLTIVAYPNHPGGDHEASAVAAWACALCEKKFEVRNLRSHYRQGKSPECWAVRKRE